MHLQISIRGTSVLVSYKSNEPVLDFQNSERSPIALLKLAFEI